MKPNDSAVCNFTKYNDMDCLCPLTHLHLPQWAGEFFLHLNLLFGHCVLGRPCDKAAQQRDGLVRRNVVERAAKDHLGQQQFVARRDFARNAAFNLHNVVNSAELESVEADNHISKGGLKKKEDDRARSRRRQVSKGERWDKEGGGGLLSNGAGKSTREQDDEYSAT